MGVGLENRGHKQEYQAVAEPQIREILIQEVGKFRESRIIVAKERHPGPRHLRIGTIT